MRDKGATLRRVMAEEVLALSIVDTDEYGLYEFPSSWLSGVFGETGDERPAHQTLWCYTAWSTRSRSRSKFALPYIMRFKSFRRVTCPSVCP